MQLTDRRARTPNTRLLEFEKLPPPSRLEGELVAELRHLGNALSG
jgi:hypothetical protein